MMDEQVFKRSADEALEAVSRALFEPSEEHDFEVDYNAGNLSIEFEGPPARFVISPNTPVRQIWISAQSRSFKLDWNGTTFALTSTGESLSVLVGRLAGEQLGVEPFRL